MPHTSADVRMLNLVANPEGGYFTVAIGVTCEGSVMSN